MTKLLQIQTSFEAGPVGTIVVTWDLQIEKDERTNSHPDDHPSTEENRSVGKIHRVELQAYDKWGIDLTGKYINRKSLLARLEYELVDAVADNSVEELEKGGVYA